MGERAATRTDIVDAITAAGLGHLRAPLEGAVRPAIEVSAVAQPSARSRARELGSSRFGGLPDLRAGARWPRVDGIPLTFVGQLDLEDVHGLEAASVLPARGLLSFFFDGMLTGYDRGEAPDRARVIYTDTAGVTLKRLARPRGAPVGLEVLEEKAPTLAATWTLPELEEVDGDEAPMFPALVPIVRAPEDQTRYRAMRRTLCGKTIGSKLFGHADAVQGGEIVFTAVMKRDGGRHHRYEDYEWTNGARLVREMRELCLLFQAASGEREPWGGTGVVYFWITRRDLEARRFSRAFAMLQTT